MGNSTTQLDTIATNQSNKEVVVNALLDAASPATLWGRHASACNGLTWGYYGGTYYTTSGANAIANGTVTLAASTTNYVYANASTGAVSVNTTGFPAGAIPLYAIVTGATTVTSYTDERSYQPSAVTSGGTVSSVGLSAPAQLTVTGSPVTGSGTLSLAWANQTANYVFAGPTSGAAAAPTFRQLVGADIPVFGASGASHSQGGVPDPGATAGTTRYLREDGSWQVPPGAGGSSALSGLTDVNVTEGAGIDQYSLVWNNATSKWIAKNVSGGGGLGTLMVPQGIARPALGTFTWLNQGTSTAVDHANGPLTMTLAAQAGDQVRALTQAVPGSTPWTVTVCVDPLLWGDSFYSGGAIIYDSGSGKLTAFDLVSNANYPPMYLQVTHWNSTTSWNGTAKQIALTPRDAPSWLRIKNDGTNLTYYVSVNGADWVQFYQEAVAAFMPAITHGGFGGDANYSASTTGETGAGAITPQINLLGFELTTGTGTNTAWIAGGGGASISEGAFSSRPSAGTSGRVYLATDDLVQSYDNGTSWDDYERGPKLTRPVLANFTQVNAGSSTLTQSGFAVVLAENNSASSVDQLRLCEISPPSSGAWTITARIEPSFAFTGFYPRIGLYARDSASGKVDCYWWAPWGPYYANEWYSSVTAWVSRTQLNGANGGYTPLHKWMRLQYDGTNLKFFVSNDGLAFVQLYSVSATHYLPVAPTGCGFVVNPDALNYSVRLLSWTATNP
jgi:hypothetical protein